MSAADKALMDAIDRKIPEFQAEQHNGAWIWTFRCAESEEKFGTLQECFVDFAATQISAIDQYLGLDDEE